MTDARWLDVEDDLGAAIRHFRNAARLYDAGGFDEPDLDGYRARMGLQHAMQAGHTSLEGALQRILDILGEETPTGPNSHADLIRRVSRPVTLPDRGRPAILTPEVAADADEARRFRRRAAHDYDNFLVERAAPSIEAARRLAHTLSPCIRLFRDRFDPPADG